MTREDLQEALTDVRAAPGRTARIAWALFKTSPRAAIDYAAGWPRRRTA